MRDKLGRFIKGNSEGFQKGHLCYLTKESIEKIRKKAKGRKFSEESRAKISERLKGNKNRLGNKQSAETKKKIGEKNRGKIQPKELRERRSKIHKGKHYSPKTEFGKKDKHIFWQGGKSFEPYGLEFNELLKEKIRNKFNRKCVECGFTEKELGNRLICHHIDYNKKNNLENNLIPLCRSCHSQTNFTRENWINYFKSWTAK